MTGPKLLNTDECSLSWVLHTVGFVRSAECILISGLLLIVSLWFSYEVLEEDSERMNLPVYFRERHAKHSGGSSGTMLFGQPLLITVPRHNLTVDTLYERVLERIGLVLFCWSILMLNWFCHLKTFVLLFPFLLGVTLNVHRVPLQTAEHLLQPHHLAAANHQNTSLQCPVTAQDWAVAVAQFQMELPAALDPMAATTPAMAPMEFVMVGY